MRLKIYFSYAKMKNWKVCEKEKKFVRKNLKLKLSKSNQGEGECWKCIR